MRRWKTMCLTVLFTLSLLLACWPQTAQAATESVTIKVGYFGGPYYEKTVLSMNDLERLGEYHELYTCLDRGGFLAYADAYGYALTDIFQAAGVDISAISRCHFKTDDSQGGYFVSLNADTLFWSERYAFPTLSSHYGTPPGEAERCISDLYLVWEDAVIVSPMLSYYDNYSRVSGEYTEYDPDDYGYTTEKGLRLFFGQTAPNTVNANQMAKWVYEVDVEFGGAPSIRMDEDQLKLKVGSDYKIRATVTSADEVITQRILQGLQWSSSDDSVVRVDSTGQITVVGKGEATITAYYKEYEDFMSPATIHVVAGDDENLSGGGSGKGDGSGTGDGSGSGSGGTGSGTGQVTPGDGENDNAQGGSGKDPSSKGDTGKDTGTKSPDQTKPDQKTPDTKKTDAEDRSHTSAEDKDTAEDDTYIRSRSELDLTQNTVQLPTLRVRRLTAVTQTASSEASAGAASTDVQGIRGQGLDGGSTALGLIMKDNPLTVFVAVASGALVLLGGWLMYVRFKRETKE